MSFFQYLKSRELKYTNKLDDLVTERLTARNLPLILREKAYPLGENDKIFSSAWLDDKNVICGSKCNKVSIHYYAEVNSSLKDYQIIMIIKNCKIICTLQIS